MSLSIPLIWGAVLLLGLLVAAVVLFVVLAKRKGRWLSISLSQDGSMDPMSASLAVKSRNLGLDPYGGAYLEFSQGPETLEFP